jgi:hypothetical protein
MFKKGEWVKIYGGKKAHKLVQGNWGLAIRCTQIAHHKGTGTSHSAHIEQEDMTNGEGVEKCKRCQKI